MHPSRPNAATKKGLRLTHATPLVSKRKTRVKCHIIIQQRHTAARQVPCQPLNSIGFGSIFRRWSRCACHPGAAPIWCAEPAASFFGNSHRRIFIHEFLSLAGISDRLPAVWPIGRALLSFVSRRWMASMRRRATLSPSTFTYLISASPSFRIFNRPLRLGRNPVSDQAAGVHAWIASSLSASTNSRIAAPSACSLWISNPLPRIG